MNYWALRDISLRKWKMLSCAFLWNMPDSYGAGQINLWKEWKQSIHGLGLTAGGSDLSEGFDHIHSLKDIPEGFDGYIWTNKTNELHLKEGKEWKLRILFPILTKKYGIFTVWGWPRAVLHECAWDICLYQLGNFIFLLVGVDCYFWQDFSKNIV